MEKNQLQQQVKELLTRFNQLDFTDVTAILEWFYDAFPFNSMFEEPQIAKFVFSKLKEHNYVANQISTANLLGIKSMLGESHEYDVLKIGNFYISQIMTYLEKAESIDNGLYSLIRIYNIKHNCEKTTSKMMNIMREYKGTEVIVVGYDNGERFFKTGLLQELVPYQTLTIDEQVYPLIGKGLAIVQVNASDGTLLYENKNIPNAYNITEHQLIEEINKLTFGSNYVKPLAIL